MSASLREKLLRLRRAERTQGARASQAGDGTLPAVATAESVATETVPPDPAGVTHEVPGAAGAAGPAALEKLEATLLGVTGEGLSLRERLERLVSAAGRRRAVDASRGPGVPGTDDDPWPDDRAPASRAPSSAKLEELVQGQRRENEHGEFFLAETEVPLESFHGQVPLSRFRTVLAESIPILSGEAELLGFDLPGAVFLDTETTGLAGGTGTAAFLIGLGFVDGDHFRVRQYFMRDYHEEAALLHGLAEDLRRFRHMVTFNGKLFDVPLLESRFRLNRALFPLSGVPHLDLLHPARRLWKLRLESCRLQSLEVALLGLRRHGDVPGELIPQMYFDYVRRRDARALCQVFRHNTTDVVSLAALAVLACQWVEGDLAEHPLDVFSLGRVLERAERHEQSEATYRRALESGSLRVRVPALLKLGERAKREARWDEAVALWQQAADDGDATALRELCVYHEHRARDLERALHHAEEALRCAAAGELRPRRLRADFERRRARLLRKLGRG